MAARRRRRLLPPPSPPAVVGQYHELSHPIPRPISFVPSSPPAPIDGGRFSLDFLPFFSEPSGWEVADSHGGLVPLKHFFASERLSVCDPLTRRYQGIQVPTEETRELLSAYLLDAEDGGTSISNFRLFVRCYNSSYWACVFSTADAGGWRILPPAQEELDLGGRLPRLAGRIDGSLYLETTRLMVLDSASLEFSEVDLPSCIDISDGSVAEPTYNVVHSAAGNFGSPPMARIVLVYLDELEVFGRVHGSGEWVLQHRIHRLSVATRGLSGYPGAKAFD